MSLEFFTFKMTWIECQWDDIDPQDSTRQKKSVIWTEQYWNDSATFRSQSHLHSHYGRSRICIPSPIKGTVHSPIMGHHSPVTGPVPFRVKNGISVIVIQSSPVKGTSPIKGTVSVTAHLRVQFWSRLWSRFYGLVYSLVFMVSFWSRGLVFGLV
jgi:hypothetical protein